MPKIENPLQIRKLKINVVNLTYVTCVPNVDISLRVCTWSIFLPKYHRNRTLRPGTSTLEYPLRDAVRHPLGGRQAANTPSYDAPMAHIHSDEMRTYTVMKCSHTQ